MGLKAEPGWRQMVRNVVGEQGVIVLLREFDERAGWNNGFVSCAHWLHWRTGIDLAASVYHPVSVYGFAQHGTALTSGQVAASYNAGNERLTLTVDACASASSTWMSAPTHRPPLDTFSTWTGWA